MVFDPCEVLFSQGSIKSLFRNLVNDLLVPAVSNNESWINVALDNALSLHGMVRVGGDVT